MIIIRFHGKTYHALYSCATIRKGYQIILDTANPQNKNKKSHEKMEKKHLYLKKTKKRANFSSSQLDTGASGDIVVMSEDISR